MSVLTEDVDMAHPLTARRIPVVTGPPRQAFHVALVIGSPGFGPAGIEPTPREADQLVAYLDFRLRDYRPHYRQQMAAAPFDVDGTVNTYTFRKSAEHGWQYNASTWTASPWFPAPGVHELRFDLPGLLDRMHDTFPSRWEAFKAESPDLWSADQSEEGPR